MGRAVRHDDPAPGRGPEPLQSPAVRRAWAGAHVAEFRTDHQHAQRRPGLQVQPRDRLLGTPGLASLPRGTRPACRALLRHEIGATPVPERDRSVAAPQGSHRCARAQARPALLLAASGSNVWGGQNRGMASKKIKATYSLDRESVRAIEALAHRWRVSKSEALRRIIANGARRQSMSAIERLEALDKLQASVRSAGIDVAEWERDVRSERRATG